MSDNQDELDRSAAERNREHSRRLKALGQAQQALVLLEMVIQDSNTALAIAARAAWIVLGVVAAYLGRNRHQQ